MLIWCPLLGSAGPSPADPDCELSLVGVVGREPADRAPAVVETLCFAVGAVGAVGDGPDTLCAVGALVGGDVGMRWPSDLLPAC